jgi:hypothetical protein
MITPAFMCNKYVTSWISAAEVYTAPDSTIVHTMGMYRFLDWLPTAVAWVIWYILPAINIVAVSWVAMVRTNVEVTHDRRSEVNTDSAGVMQFAMRVFKPQTVMRIEVRLGGYGCGKVE